MSRPVVVLGPQDEPVAALRLVAHMEAGDQVVYEGSLTGEPWWPSVEPTVMALLRARGAQ